jgi:mycothiol system anti-sigma-R factor
MTAACEHAIEYVYNYLDDEVTVTRRTRIRWHLRRCAACTSAYDFEARLKQVIRDRGRSEPPPELFDTLRALLKEERANPHLDE